MSILWIGIIGPLNLNTKKYVCVICSIFASVFTAEWKISHVLQCNFVEAKFNSVEYNGINTDPTLIRENDKAFLSDFLTAGRVNKKQWFEIYCKLKCRKILIFMNDLVADSELEFSQENQYMLTTFPWQNIKNIKQVK